MNVISMQTHIPWPVALLIGTIGPVLVLLVLSKLFRSAIAGEFIRMMTGRVSELQPITLKQGPWFVFRLFIVQVLTMGSLAYAIAAGAGDPKVAENGPLTAAAEKLGLLGIALVVMFWGFGEECVFRAVPGWIVRMLGGTAAFYIVMLLANAVFASIHLLNYAGPVLSNLPYVTLTFVEGLFLVYAYRKGGLLCSGALHMLMNGVLVGTLIFYEMSKHGGIR